VNNLHQTMGYAASVHTDLGPVKLRFWCSL